MPGRFNAPAGRVRARVPRAQPVVVDLDRESVIKLLCEVLSCTAMLPRGLAATAHVLTDSDGRKVLHTRR